MIKFSSKTDALPKPADADENRFDFIRKTAAAQHRKSSDAAQQRDRPVVEDDQVE
jgi:hypothetical protein